MRLFDACVVSLDTRCTRTMSGEEPLSIVPHPQSHQSVLTIGGPIILLLLLLDRIAFAAAAAAYLSPAERKEGERNPGQFHILPPL